MKIENSGVKNQQECDEVNAYHNRLGFDFEIKPENTINNPGLRQVAKICLNSLWGKFGQRCGMDEYEFIFDYDVLIRKFINNNKIMDTTWNIISEDCAAWMFAATRLRVPRPCFLGSLFSRTVLVPVREINILKNYNCEKLGSEIARKKRVDGKALIAI